MPPAPRKRTRTATTSKENSSRDVHTRFIRVPAAASTGALTGSRPATKPESIVIQATSESPTSKFTRLQVLSSMSSMATAALSVDTDNCLTTSSIQAASTQAHDVPETNNSQKSSAGQLFETQNVVKEMQDALEEFRKTFETMSAILCENDQFASSCLCEVAKAHKIVKKREKLLESVSSKKMNEAKFLFNV